MKEKKFRAVLLGLVVSSLSLLSPVFCYGVEHPEEVSERVTIDQNLGQKLDLTTEVTNSSGEKIKLGELFKSGKPVIFTPVYYECPRLCNLVLNGLLDTVNELELKLGEDYEIVSLSFNPTETAELAKSKSENYFSKLKAPERGPQGWHFLTGSAESIRTIMNQIGFHYFRDPENGEFAHAAVLVLLTPDGEISRYFYGIQFSAWDMKLSLIEASKGGIGSILDKALLFCFHFDPKKGKYTWMAFNIARTGALITLAALGVLLFRLWQRTPT